MAPTNVTPCTIWDITVDASICGTIYPAKDFDGDTVVYVPSFTGKSPFDFSLYCSNCGTDEAVRGDFHEAVMRHINASKGGE